MQNSSVDVSIDAGNKLIRLIEAMRSHHVQAYYVPPEDEHLNEYLPENRKRIEWLTGFSGESAPLLVLPHKMQLYVDGRFHIQVDDEVDPNTVEAVKLGLNEAAAPLIAKTLAAHAAKQSSAVTVGYDPFLMSPGRLTGLKKWMPETGLIQWIPVSPNLVDGIWLNRPASVASPASLLSEEAIGYNVAEKLSQIREYMEQHGIDVLPVTKLDEVGWLVNLAGQDIPYNPVLEAYAILTADTATVFTDLDKITPDVRSQRENEGITFAQYDDYSQALSNVVQPNGRQKTVLIDVHSATVGTLDIAKAQATIVDAENPILMKKAIKNSAELNQMEIANFRASRGIIRHLAAISHAFAQGQLLSEETVRADLEAKYQEEPGFSDLSFPTIPGIGFNSAIIHYSHADHNNVGKDGDFYLLDSGCHYGAGTTDTTRTTVFGTPSAEQIDRYTSVLQAHIACAALIFPKGTNGAQIDAVGRARMWAHQIDFEHGTGHGVGIFNVHEGPNRISKLGATAFLPGMITSIEPGYYQKDWGGIRLENLYTVVHATGSSDTAARQWFTFAPLTYVPFEKKLIDISRLTQDEKRWLANYYHSIEAKIMPTLSDPIEQHWLKDQLALPLS